MKKYLSIVLILYLISACGKRTEAIKISTAISQTQTVAVSSTLESIYRTATHSVPKIEQDFQINYGNTIEYKEAGVSFIYDKEIFAGVEANILPSKEKWLPFHLQVITEKENNIAPLQNVPDYFYYKLLFNKNLFADLGPAYVEIRPIKNAEGQTYPELQEDQVLSSELDKLVTRLEEKSVADRFFSSSKPFLESHRDFITFQNGSGIRYVTAYPKDKYPLQIDPNGLAYVFEGITTNGRYYIECIVGLKFPKLKDYELSAESIAAYKQNPSSYHDYIKNIDWQLRMVAEDQFMPRVDILDEWIKSFYVEPEIRIDSLSESQVRRDELGLGKPTFEDTFEKAPNYIFLGKDPFTQTEARDGSLIFTSLMTNADRWRMIELYPLGDAYIEILGRHGDTCAGKDGFGLIIRSIPMGSTYNSGYIFGLSCDGMFRIYKLDSNGRYFGISDWKADKNILAGPNRINRLGVLAKGSSFTMYVNNQSIYQFEDDMFSSGSYGIMISSPVTENYKVYIDEFAFWNLYEKAIMVPTPTSVKDVYYLPLSLSECEQIQLELNKRLKLSSKRVEYPFFDPLNENARGKSCHIEYTATGSQVNRASMLEALTVFSDLEWLADNAYDASGNLEETRAFRKADDRIAIVQMKWKPAENVTCPAEKTMTQCISELDPELVIYSMIIDAAQKTVITPTPPQ